MTNRTSPAPVIGSTIVLKQRIVNDDLAAFKQEKKGNPEIVVNVMSDKKLYVAVQGLTPTVHLILWNNWNFCKPPLSYFELLNLEL